MANKNFTEENGLLGILLLVLKIKNILFLHWKSVLIFGLVGGGVGCGVWYKQKEIYNSSFSIITSASDSKGGGLGKYLQLAQSLGVSGGDQALLSPNNVKELLVSKRIVYAALLSKVKIEGVEDRLINFYIDWFNLTEGPDKKRVANINKEYNSDLSIEEEGLLRMVHGRIVNRDMSIKTSIKTAIIKVSFTSKQNLFAYHFSNELSKSLYKFYEKNIKQDEEASILLFRHTCDSILDVLNKKEEQLAALRDKSLLIIKSVGSLEKSKLEREVRFLNSSFMSSLKNLEMAEFSRNKDNKIFEILDKPVLSMRGEKKGVAYMIVLVGFLFSFGRLMYVVIAFELNKVRKIASENLKIIE